MGSTQQQQPDETQADTMIWLHLSDATPIQEEEIQLADGKTATVLWKDVLVEGKYPMSPSATGAVEEEMTVIPTGKSDAKTKTISMSEIIESHEDAAFKYVTIPTTHKDGVLDNTGYVPRPKGIRVVKRGDKSVMQAALGFTEPDVKGKVQRGTIPDVSAGIFFNWLNKHKKKRYPVAMKHVALTNIPFMGNLGSFPAVFASDEELKDLPESTHVEVYDFADDATSTVDDTSSETTGEVVWDETQGSNWLRQQVESALRPDTQSLDDGRPYVPRPYYWVKDVGSDKALVQEEFKGATTSFVIPFTKGDNDITLAPQTRWVEVKEAMIAASDKTPDNFTERSSEKLCEQLSVVLSEQLGEAGADLAIEEVSLDQRTRIVNTENEAAWLADFLMYDDGKLAIAPVDRWESIAAPKPPKDDVKRPAPSAAKPSSVKLDDTELRQRVARQRRQAMLAGTATK